MNAAAQAAKLARPTRYVRMGALRHVLNYLHEEHGAPKMAKAVPKVKKPAPRDVTATVDERTAVLAAASPAMRCFILLCSDMAIRSGTAVKIAPHHYNPERRELSFRTKFDTAQTLPVTTELAAIFASCKGNPATPYVSQLSQAGHLRHTTVLNNFAKLRRKVGITRRVTPHDFRRTTAVATYEITKDLRVVQALLGHSELATTLHYLDHRNTPVGKSVLELAKLNPNVSRLAKLNLETETIQ